jgi:hypothetical protein
MIRCVKCGCSRLDSEGNKCALCGGSPALRMEPCHVTEDTKDKLLAHAEELKTFGLSLEESKSLRKIVGALEVFGIVLAVADSLNSGVLRKVILFLRQIAIPKDEILRLRLDEPEQVLTYYRADRAENVRRIDPKLKERLLPMAKHDELIIEKRNDGRWSIMKPHAERPSAVEDTQREAIDRAKGLAPEGDIKVKGLNGKFRHIRKR